MDGEVDMVMVVVVVGSGVGVFLMRRVEASPRCSSVAASDEAASRVFCGNRIFRRDLLPDAATIGMSFLII